MNNKRKREKKREWGTLGKSVEWPYSVASLGSINEGCVFWFVGWLSPPFLLACFFAFCLLACLLACLRGLLPRSPTAATPAAQMIVEKKNRNECTKKKVKSKKNDSQDLSKKSAEGDSEMSRLLSGKLACLLFVSPFLFLKKT